MKKPRIIADVKWFRDYNTPWILFAGEESPNISRESTRGKENTRSSSYETPGIVRVFFFFSRRAPDVGHSSFAIAKDLHTAAGYISGIHFLAVLLHSNCSSIGSPSCAIRGCVCASESRIKIDARRACVRGHECNAYTFVRVRRFYTR